MRWEGENDNGEADVGEKTGRVSGKSPKERRGLRRRLLDRVQASFDDVIALGKVLVHEPRRFPGALVHRVGSGLHALWQSRGGGFYGLGVVAAFVYLEVATFASEFSQSDGVVDFVLSEALEHVLRFSLMSVVNGLLAAIWPLLLAGQIGVGPVLVLILVGYGSFKLWNRRAKSGGAAE